MCGRARCSLAREAVTAAAGVSEQRWHDAGQYRPSYNCSPGAYLPVIRMGPDGSRELHTMKWGLVPGFTRLGPGERPDHYRMFNARSESLAQKSVFSRLLPGKRCVLLLDGFYEWLGGQAGRRKQPYYITTADGQQQPAMYLAGLYDMYRDANGDELYTVTIITTDSSKPLTWLHDRMPVILTTPEEVAEWLGEGGSSGAASGGELLSPSSKHPQTPQAPGSSLKPSTSAGTASGGRQRAGHGDEVAAVKAEPDSAEGKATELRGEGRLDSDGDGDGGGTHGVEDVGSSAEEDDHGAPGGASGTPKGAAVRRARLSGGKGHGKQDDGSRQQYAALVEQLCRPYGGPLLRWHPVTPEMGKPGYDKPDCCKDVRTKKGSIGSFFKPAVKPATTTSSPVKKEQQPAPTGAQMDALVGVGDPQEQQQEAKAVKAEAAATRNPDECEGADGGALSAGTRVASGKKRPAEVKAKRSGSAVKKR